MGGRGVVDSGVGLVSGEGSLSSVGVGGVPKVAVVPDVRQGQGVGVLSKQGQGVGSRVGVGSVAVSVSDYSFGRSSLRSVDLDLSKEKSRVDFGFPSLGGSGRGVFGVEVRRFACRKS